METSSSMDRATASAKRAAAEAKERARAEGERLVGEARSEAESFASARREVVAGYLRDVSDALGSAGATLEERGRSGTARGVRVAAEEVGNLSERVHNQDVGRAIYAVEDFARNRPGLFFGGAFLIGFAATRMLSDRSDVGRRGRRGIGRRSEVDVADGDDALLGNPGTPETNF